MKCSPCVQKQNQQFTSVYAVMGAFNVRCLFCMGAYKCDVVVLIKIPYTRVNKCIRLFPKVRGIMRLIPNTHLIMKGKKLTTPQKPRRLFVSTCT